MGNILLTSQQVDLDTMDLEVAKNSDFFVLVTDFKLKEDDIESITFYANLYFSQTKNPLYIYNGFKLNKTLENSYKIVNLGLLNDDSIVRSDERLIPIEDMLFSAKDLKDVIAKGLKSKLTEITIK